MPYRRLPNTNQARLRSLHQAIDMGDMVDLYDLAYSYKYWEEARGFIVRYERAIFEYTQSNERQIQANKGYQQQVKNARLYVSHFVQVMNLCIQRGEIKPEVKELFGLEPDNFTVPDLSSDENLISWGKKIIEGEQNRIRNGGAPIYNPAIAKVNVHYDIFLDGYNNQKILQKNTARAIENIAQLNTEADQLILNIWDEVEKTYATLPLKERIEKCQKYGIIYYYRKGENPIE